MRYTLKLLLMYKGWMYESREKGQSISTQTKLWGGITRVLSSWNKPGLYSFQGSLPRLPLPSVHETMERVRVAPVDSFFKLKLLKIFAILTPPYAYICFK